jgi:hypothetical protein
VPQLNKKQAAETAKAEGSFEPLDDGVYHVRLAGVEVKEGKNGPYWAWEFEVVQEPYVNRKLWTNTSLSEAAAWKVKEAFDAFGVGTDTDTDELVGQVCKAAVSSRVQQEGAGKGQTRNQVDRLLLADDDFEAPEVATSKAGAADDEDLF